MDIEKLVAAINKNFQPPFVKKGLVEAWLNDRGDFCLRIGPRDIQLSPEGNFLGAGTLMIEEEES